jgi:hypothetical protein
MSRLGIGFIIGFFIGFLVAIVIMSLLIYSYLEGHAIN